jgi:2-polyprenyl-3-methyl-5-hydroxy-6-metoxy-1,4-benzoquinol methylase
MAEHDPGRHGAKQPRRFDPARAAVLDDPSRFSYLPPSDIVTLLDAPLRSLVVDFGAGTGTYAIAIARLRPDLRVVAVDEQVEMLALMRSKLESQPLSNVEPMGAEALEALRGRADRVMAINVLHEVGDAALDRLIALLSRSGMVLFVDWNGDVERPVGPPRDHVYGVEEARARLERCGLAVTLDRIFTYHYAFAARPTV